jgi:hypothetical protein
VTGGSFDAFRWGTPELDVGVRIRDIGSVEFVAVNPLVFVLIGDFGFCGGHLLV